MGTAVYRASSSFSDLTHEYPKIITRMGVDDGINAARALLRSL